MSLEKLLNCIVVLGIRIIIATGDIQNPLKNPWHIMSPQIWYSFLLGIRFQYLLMKKSSSRELESVPKVIQLVNGENVAGHQHPQPEVVVKSTGLGMRQAWSWVLRLSSCVILGKSVNIPEPQSHLQNGDISTSLLTTPTGLAQLQGWRQTPESATETWVVNGEGSLPVWSQVLEQHSPCAADAWKDVLAVFAPGDGRGRGTYQL